MTTLFPLDKIDYPYFINYSHVVVVEGKLPFTLCQPCWLTNRQSDSSAASFEKALSKLSAQIGTATVSLDKTRARNRRAKAIWTLYTSLAYLLSVLILVLVIGPQNWDIPHYGGLIGAPALIFGVRKGITAAFGWSISRQQANVNRLQKQREAKISELKKATKYDSTQELLQKYGGAPPRPVEETSKQDMKKSGKSPQQRTPVQRTGLPPPPTANIPSRSGPVHALVTQPHGSAPNSPQSVMQRRTNIDEPGFAPNAFSEPPPPRAAHDHAPHWYDRILDVMLGEDENLAKNRIVLLCQSCRQVNGQAPPGIKTLEDLGKWRCQNCGAWNGTQAEATRMIQEATASKELPPIPAEDDGAHESSPPAEIHSIEENEGSTGRAEEKEESVTKRVTRSSGKLEEESL